MAIEDGGEATIGAAFKVRIGVVGTESVAGERWGVNVEVRIGDVWTWGNSGDGG